MRAAAAGKGLGDCDVVPVGDEVVKADEGVGEGVKVGVGVSWGEGTRIGVERATVEVTGLGFGEGVGEGV